MNAIISCYMGYMGDAISAIRVSYRCYGVVKKLTTVNVDLTTMDDRVATTISCL